MSDGLVEYVLRHTERGECGCGKCIDRGTAPEPAGHTIDMVFFRVAKRGEPTAEEFKRLAQAWPGEFCQLDPFDGKEHGYMELGGWIGDQGIAMQFMALGVLLGHFQLLSPALLGLSGGAAVECAANGFLAVLPAPSGQAHPTSEAR